MVIVPTHAGGVVYHVENNNVKYLLVSSSDGVHWVLPKGHIEAGETVEQAALREVMEETGVKGAVIKKLSVHRYEKLQKEVIVQYFIIKSTSITPPQEDRTLRWEDEDTAYNLLSFDDARTVLKEAVEAISL